MKTKTVKVKTIRELTKNIKPREATQIPNLKMKREINVQIYLLKTKGYSFVQINKMLELNKSVTSLKSIHAAMQRAFVHYPLFKKYGLV